MVNGESWDEGREADEVAMVGLAWLELHQGHMKQQAASSCVLWQWASSLLACLACRERLRA